ncbi:LIM-domain binding protein-domain-containing protein [Microdochium trichocladiopsis]|uniref:LIM-domain binding protein-domain-containing protein n=1 Tax=Microdochium trichocladiopsis TaxID=1682393 RepID=A0A9P8XWF0_9PEZI|nr:LIM-domain binding protein-domain-containing protein [Microdochium trichocladiopsis]KAH7021425.1 LIM-domain binding protein-domain-containing protein [Microdochium trichocladiopsis]
MQFNEHLSGPPAGSAKDDTAYWQAFVNQFFSQQATFRLIPLKTEPIDCGDGSKHHDLPQFDIPQVALARFFQLSFEGGIRSMTLTLGKGTVDKGLPGNGHYIENGKSSFIQWMDDSHVVWHGSLRVHFDGEQKFQLFEFNITSHDEFLAHASVLEAAKPSHEWGKQWKNLNDPAPGAKSPEMSKKPKPKTMKSPPGPPPDIALSETIITRQGVPKGVSPFLEMCEVMGYMTPLFHQTQANPGVGPYAALEQYVNTVISASGQVAMANGQGNIPQQPRTPSFGQFGMGASPAAAHMALPGSPHIANTGSPAQGQMQAPAMQLQASQQGTSSSGPSANTSPASNKRRRPSGVKTEDDGGNAIAAGGQVNGMGVAKKPATPRMAKRAKGNPA